MISVARMSIASDGTSNHFQSALAIGIQRAVMNTSSGRINFFNQQMSSPLTTLVRKTSAHRPNDGSTVRTPTQPQSPLIHTKFRGSVATASSYDTSRFQDEESVLVDVQTSDSTVRTFQRHLIHARSFRTVSQSPATTHRTLEPPRN